MIFRFIDNDDEHYNYKWSVQTGKQTEIKTQSGGEINNKQIKIVIPSLNQLKSTFADLDNYINIYLRDDYELPIYLNNYLKDQLPIRQFLYMVSNFVVVEGCDNGWDQCLIDLLNNKENYESYYYNVRIMIIEIKSHLQFINSSSINLSDIMKNICDVDFPDYVDDLDIDYFIELMELIITVTDEDNNLIRLILIFFINYQLYIMYPKKDVTEILSLTNQIMTIKKENISEQIKNKKILIPNKKDLRQLINKIRKIKKYRLVKNN